MNIYIYIICTCDFIINLNLQAQHEPREDDTITSIQFVGDSLTGHYMAKIVRIRV